MDNVNLLAEAFLCVSSQQECIELLRDICTEKELEEMANRFTIAVMLHQRKTFVEIEKKTHSSSATISRVNRSLKTGKGYSQIIQNVLDHRERSQCVNDENNDK